MNSSVTCRTGGEGGGGGGCGGVGGGGLDQRRLDTLTGLPAHTRMTVT